MTNGAVELRETSNEILTAVPLACLALIGLTYKSVADSMRCGEAVLHAKSTSEIARLIEDNARAQFDAFSDELEELLAIADPDAESLGATFWD